VLAYLRKLLSRFIYGSAAVVGSGFPSEIEVELDQLAGPGFLTVFADEFLLESGLHLFYELILVEFRVLIGPIVFVLGNEGSDLIALWKELLTCHFCNDVDFE
jgi:hypothetical protein